MLVSRRIRETAALVDLGLRGKWVQYEHQLNDDKIPLIDLISCIVCTETMKLEKGTPDAEGNDIIQYRCDLCNRIERLRLFRRSRDVAGCRRGKMSDQPPYGAI